MIIHGIQVLNGVSGDWSFAKIVALAPVKDFENSVIKFRGIGLSCNTDTKGKPDFPNIDYDYAEKLINTRAFVSGKDYEFKFAMDPNTLKAIVVELIPTEPAVLKHFNECLGIK
jgi:Protein of unknown function (DUF1293)